MSDELEPFVYRLSSLTTEESEPLCLAPEVQAEVDTKLADIREARARACASGQNYLVWR